MAEFPDLTPTETLNTADECVLRQGTTDKRIKFELAATLAWATRNGYLRLGDHVTGIEYSSYEEFTTYNGKTYFVKGTESLPYTSTQTDPNVDTGLTTKPYEAYKDTVDAIHEIGDTLFRFDDVSPEVKYPWQSWDLVTGDASIRLGDGSDNGTGIYGDQTPYAGNEPLVPLPQHTHGATSTFTSYPHNHGGVLDEYGDGEFANPTAGDELLKGETEDATVIGTVTTTIAQEGTAQATIDTRGLYVKMNVWVRTA